MLRQKIFKSGNSLSVVVPSQFVKDAGVKAGDDVYLDLDQNNGKIIYQFPSTRQLSLNFKNLKH